MPRVRVAHIDEIPRGAARFFPLDGRPVAIARRGDRVYALDGICPHKGFELDHALVIDGCIECPWHGYRYDLATGGNVFPGRVYLGDVARPAEPISIYPVDVVDGEIWVDLP